MTDPFADLKTGFSSMMLASGVIIELGLLYLLLTQPLETKIVATLVVFGGFLSLSFWKLLSGAQGCGCFGSFEVPPIISSAINTLVLVVTIFAGSLAFGGPREMLHRLRPTFSSDHDSRVLNRCLGIGASLVAISLASGNPWVNSRLGFIGFASPVSAAPVDLGELAEEDEVTAMLVLTNTTSREARLVGFSRSCTCMATAASGQIVPARGELKVSVALKRKRDGYFHHRLRFFVDHPDQFSVDADIMGRWKSF